MDRMGPVHQFLRDATYTREQVDRYLDPAARIWARFDPDLGYLLRTSFMRDGMDGASTLSRYASGDSPRHQCHFPDVPARINTYGNSFTQGHQVSDGETWQEVLAAHFCEPIRNYGIGGHGVYQAYRRLLKVEQTAEGAPWLIFNLWGDDHQRSINPWRWLAYADSWSQAHMRDIFHGNPWDHARLDPDTGALVEVESGHDTPESLYHLCDPEYVIETFQHDPVIRILVALRTNGAVDPEPMRRMAAALRKDYGWSSDEEIRSSAWKLYNEYSWETTLKILEKLRAWCDSREKNLFVLLSYPEPSVRDACAGKDRDAPDALDWHPKEFRESLDTLGIRWLDILPAHVGEYGSFRLSPEEYTARYYIGHYNPKGNAFFAWAIKDALKDWLDPKPPAYASQDEAVMRFEGYLPG